MTIPSPTWRYLEHDPKSSYKQLSIKGRRIKARTLYGLTQGEEAMTPEEVAADRDLPLDAVLEAIAYCELDPPEIREDFLREEASMEAMGMNDPNYKYHGKPRLLTARELARNSPLDKKRSPMTLERELQAYQRELPKLLDRQGKFAVFHEDALAGVWDTYEDALQAGYGKFGLQSFLVKQITATEQVHSITRDVEIPCRT